MVATTYYVPQQQLAPEKEQAQTIPLANNIQPDFRSIKDDICYSNNFSTAKHLELQFFYIKEAYKVYKVIFISLTPKAPQGRKACLSLEDVVEYSECDAESTVSAILDYTDIDVATSDTESALSSDNDIDVSDQEVEAYIYGILERYIILLQ